MRGIAALLVLAASAVGSTGCQSTQARSAQLEREGAKQLAVAEQGLVVRAESRTVRVVETAVVSDENGAAVVVTLRNNSARAIGRVPLAIEVRGEGGKPVYANDIPGLDPSLVEATGLPAGGEVAWVNDQVTPSGKPAAVEARVGAERGAGPARIPRIDVTAPRLALDAVTGTEAIGRVTNRSDVEQRRLVVFCVARRGGKVVAAGRAIVNRLAPGKGAPYHVFFIGDPRGARLAVAAPPTVLA